MLRTVELILLALGAVITAFGLGKGFKWNTQRVAKKQVLHEVNETALQEYVDQRKALDARTTITDYDAAVRSLQSRNSDSG